MNIWKCPFTNIIPKFWLQILKVGYSIVNAHDAAIWLIRNPFVVLHLHNWPNSFCMKYINVWGIIAISILFLLYVLLLQCFGSIPKFWLHILKVGYSIVNAHDAAIWIIRNPFVVLHLHNWPNSFCMKYINVWGIIAISISFFMYVCTPFTMFWINSSLMKQNNPFANIGTVKVLFCLIITYSCKCARVYTTIDWKEFWRTGQLL